MCVEFLDIVLNLKYDEEINYENLEYIFRHAIRTINKFREQPNQSEKSSILSGKERKRLDKYLQQRKNN